MKMRLAAKTLAPVALLLVLGALGWVGQALADEKEEPAPVTSVFEVKGMTCGGCEAGVKAKVKKLDGVKDVAASYKEGRATVTYDREKVTPEEIIEAIEELGYSAKLAGSEDAKGDKAAEKSLFAKLLACC